MTTRLLSLLMMMVIYINANSQSGITNTGKGPSGKSISDLKSLYGYNKVYPVEFEEQILTALSFFRNLKIIASIFNYAKAMHLYLPGQRMEACSGALKKESIKFSSVPAEKTGGTASFLKMHLLKPALVYWGMSLAMCLIFRK